MNTNFTFLQAEFPELYIEMIEAEKFTFTAPRHAAVLCRIVLEKSLFWLYKNDEDLELPYDTKLASLLHADSFKQIIKPFMFSELDVVRRIGNEAAHGKKVRALEALNALKNTFRFLSWLSKYYSETNPDIPVFDERFIPYGGEKDKSAKQLEALVAENDKKRREAEKVLKRNELLAEENEALKAQLGEQLRIISERKQERTEEYKNIEPVPELTSEQETRKQLIDLLLKEAGWNNFQQGRDVEFEVSDIPLSTNPSGKGFVDYVLWDDNGKPLAVVEAKSTLYDATKGKHQAVLYADALEVKFSQRPLIFYSNGYKTYLWDDHFYPSREVYGFYTKEELQVLIRRRLERTDLRNFKINQQIAGRPYQLQAIQRIAEEMVTINQNKLSGRHRKALLVMATGSGKTRTAAAMVDMFTKCNWAKRILFLADRNALVTQAKNAFKEYLPHLSAIDLTKEKEDTEARVVFSTYPTILNRIDDTKNDDQKLFSIGHFDVIIIDEAHRSVYQKYKAIFDYFDAILIGLTATPKKDVDKNTYQLFEIEDDNPTFAYELDAAVQAGYLVPPKAFTVPVKFPREGLKYSELSEKDKNHFEELFGITTGENAELDQIEIPKSKINSFLFNKKTVDLVLEYLMNHGLKIESGDKLGKTIIFAKNHKHAKFIEERFNKNYPEYGGSFLQVIDNYSDKTQDLLERFCFDKGKEKDPQIAVSVDMMDTGVDAPRVLNLVFFKEIKSYAKYWQMIGRGTRLCPNIFGIGQDKEYFLIFDICANFEFFEDKPEGFSSKTTKPLQQRLFEVQLEIIFTIQINAKASDDEKDLEQMYIDQLHAKIESLDEARFEVRKNWEYVKKYKNKENWYNLNNSAILEIQNHLSHLISYADDRDEMAKKFDLIIYQLELAILNNEKKQQSIIVNIANIGNSLKKKINIPAIKQRETIINNVTNDQFWATITLARLENLRVELRDLLQFLKDEEKETPIYSNFEDFLDELSVKEYDLLSSYTTLQSYKDRVESFIRKNKNHLVIDKLYKNIPITEVELKLLEEFLNEEKFTVSQIEKEYNGIALGVFVRKILGLDVEVANKHFAQFIQEENLNANQMLFIQKIIDYLSKNGVLDKSMLTQPPFTDYSDQGVMGVFKDTSKIVKIIQLIEKVNNNAQLVS
ncbi:DEAD/DEAH box helicase family protein [Myroides sp. ZB35]|uniref:DEAD/DEAH box helicase family protein n=1 Tax=Myroides sp. ZB35 TaxID=1458492 RepID=UPI0008F4C837|nr:DEAD/DEAH box helicase family protein [Myroides sp. ZB35]APA92224.1 restriction endonuclease [Myroides sp. ZB35]